MVDLPLRFFLEGEHYVLVEAKDAAYVDDDDVEEVGAWEAQRVLESALAHDHAHAQLRRALGGHTSGSWEDRHGFVRSTRARVDEDPDRLVLLRRRRPIFALVLDQPLLDDLADLADLVPTDDRPEDTWIEVLVVDDDDEPVAGVEYEIVLSDGRVRRGQTSEHGILRHEGMPPGSCKVRLLGVEARGWERA